MRILRNVYFSFASGMNLLFPCILRGTQIGAATALLMLLLKPAYMRDAMSLGFLIGLSSEAILTQKKLDGGAR
jgi:hypothetical protein